jgi:hypothetical protein
VGEGSTESDVRVPYFRQESVAAGAAFAFYLAAAVVMTWPLAKAPSRIGLPNMDVYGNAWAMASVLHQLVHDPRHLFDSNMFFPWERSLAYAESLLPQALQAAPVRALGGSALLAYNLVFLSTFALSGLGAYLLAADLSHSRASGFLAGLAFAFCAYRWDHVVHVQSLSTQWLPLALWFARRSLRRGRALDLAGLGVSTLLQVLSSGYYGMLLLWALGLTFAWVAWRTRDLRPFLRPAAAVVAAVALAAPVFWQYRAMQVKHGFSRSRREAIAWSARPQSYIEPGVSASWPHTVALSRVARDGEPLFPGTWPLAFGLWGLVRFRRHPDGALALAWTLLGFALSLGPVLRVPGLELPGPYELFRWLPGGALLRTPSRLGVLALLGLGVLAAMAWGRDVAARRHAAAWTALAAAVIVLEAYPTGLREQLRDMPRPPASVEWLARAERGVVLELPWSQPADSALYIYWSTGHWQPMVNGYGSFDPPGNADLGVVGHGWPSVHTARVFRGYGVRYLVVHADRLTDRRRERLASAALPEGVRLAASFAETRVYELTPP